MDKNIKYYFDNMNSLVVVMDKKANIKMLNKFGLNLLGFKEEEILGKNWFEIGVLPDDNLNIVKEYFEDSIAGKIDLNSDVFENELLDKNKNRIIFKWSNTFTFDNEEIKEIICSGIDITNEKRQLKIIHEQSKLASMGEMISYIAHQWRQPLSYISTSATSLLVHNQIGTLDDQKLKESLNKINDTTLHLSKIIDTFTNFIKKDKRLEKAVLQDILNEAVTIVSSAFKDLDIQLKSKVNECERVNVKLVTGELSEVILNILNNAKDVLLEKNIDEPWVKIDLKIAQNKAIITIEDNGGGIKKDVMPKIFEPYFTTKHKSQGTGLGLHMSYKIVTESLKSKIYVENSKYGAKFFIEIPLLQEKY